MDESVIPKKALQILVMGLPLTLVGFAVLMGAAALTRAMEDGPGAQVLTWIAAAFMMVGIADVLLLVILLGLKALGEETEDSASGDG